MIELDVNLSDCHCPICWEEEFLVPRVIKCGHIFCFPCILQYLSVSEEDDQRRHCPLCGESFDKRDLKTVNIQHFKLPKVDEIVILKLIERDNCSIVNRNVIENQNKFETSFHFESNTEYETRIKIADNFRELLVG